MARAYEVEWTVKQRIIVPDDMSDSDFDDAVEKLDVSECQNVNTYVHDIRNPGDLRPTDLVWDNEKRGWK